MKLPEQKTIDRILISLLVLILVVANYYAGFVHGSVLTKLECMCYDRQVSN